MTSVFGANGDYINANIGGPPLTDFTDFDDRCSLIDIFEIGCPDQSHIAFSWLNVPPICSIVSDFDTHFRPVELR